jgi:formate hydrogenlyase transcriptional activator
VLEGGGCTRFYPSGLGARFPKVKLAGDRAPESYFGAPMFDAQKRVIGHLVVTHNQPMDDDPLLFSVVETFAARAGAELERARATHRERAILDVNNAIISNLTEKELLQAIAEALARVVPFDRAALTLHDPATDTLRILALSGQLPPRNYPVGVALDRKDSHVGWVFENRRTLLRRNLETERQFSPEHRLYDEGMRSLCTAPLLLAGTCIGTLTLGSATPNQFTEVEELFLRDVSNQLALAISNMRSFEEIAALKARLQAENLYLQEEIRGEYNFSEIVGQSAALRELLLQVDQVAPIDSTVLITGETGSGKELVARAIHDRSARKARSLVKVNCGAISAGLVESELFGHVKGAFTGALGNRDGRFKLADGGTIFLDEIGELPLDAQVKLLRVLQEQEFEPVGSSKSVKVDVRVIAATNRDLAAAVAAGKFRGDLFYRLNVVPIRVPPLRERAGDVELLVQFFVQKFAKKFDRPIRRITPETMDRLRAYAWPGNIRELQNVVERAVVLARSDTLTVAADIAAGPTPPATPAPAVPPSATADETLNDVERRHIEAVLLQKNWTIEGDRGAARVLNLHPNTLRSRIKKLGLRRPGDTA